jgi:hypothetical protein
VKPGGAIGIAGAAAMAELDAVVPGHLERWWTPDLWCLHSAGWWRQHWERTGLVTVETADTLPDGWRLWREWVELVAPENQIELDALSADAGRHLGYARVVGRRRMDADVPEPIATVTTRYAAHPLLRSET